MAKSVFYIFGSNNPDCTPSVYDNSGNFDRYRLFFCDNEKDLPENPSPFDLAILKETCKFMFVRKEEWVEIGSKE